MITLFIGLALIFAKLSESNQENLTVALIIGIFLDAFLTIPLLLSFLK